MRRKSIYAFVTFLMLLSIALGIFYISEIKVYRLRSEGFRQFSTENFNILYKPESRKDLPVVAEAAEKAYEIVGLDFGYFPEKRVTVVMYPDSRSLQKAFGWPLDESNQGVYYQDIIYIQAPGAWITDRRDIDKEFFENGPMVHEYTHLVVDDLTGGNHTRWFTEGVAQYEEEKVTGYTLRQDFEIKEGDYYPLEDIFYSFDSLSDVAKAYITALDMTKTLAGDKGTEAIKQIMADLKSGESANDIFLARVQGEISEGKLFFAKNISNNGGGIFE